ncbi:MAG TPA: hypothetical protein VG370_23825 [Chloroflexota bacterium]|jgi:hypothetical protein|nr:hypothetical protein [Chloroflexota bacterium]
MATVAELEQQNPNIRRQYETWRRERVDKGEDQYDYQAFRKHVMAIGAPDPGEEEFEEFREGFVAVRGNTLPNF